MMEIGRLCSVHGCVSHRLPAADKTIVDHPKESGVGASLCHRSSKRSRFNSGQRGGLRPEGPCHLPQGSGSALSVTHKFGLKARGKMWVTDRPGERWSVSVPGKAVLKTPHSRRWRERRGGRLVAPASGVRACLPPLSQPGHPPPHAPMPARRSQSLGGS